MGNILLVIAAVAMVFLQSWILFPRRVLGAQLDCLPLLMVYAGLNKGLPTLSMIAVIGGLCFDALSANPIGVSIFPLFLVGFLIYHRRSFILKEELYAQVLLGFGACVLTPLLTLFFLISMGQKPLIGWGTGIQVVVMGAGGAALAPLVYRLFERVERNEAVPTASEPSFRQDRQIIRGRS